MLVRSDGNATPVSFPILWVGKEEVKPQGINISHVSSSLIMGRLEMCSLICQYLKIL